MTPTPQERREVALGSVVRVISGFAFEAQRFGETGDIPIVRIRDVVRGRSATYYSGPYDSRFLVNDGDLLVGMDGDFNRARWKGGKALLNQRVCRLEPTDERLDADYLYHFLQPALSKIHDETPYATVKHLSSKTIAAIGIPLPPLPEQRRIAAILDAADALRAKRRATIAALDTLTQSIFLEMFGDPVTNPRRWRHEPLGRIARFKSGEFLPKSEMRVGDIPVFGGNGVTGFHDRALFGTPQLVIGRVGVYCGCIHLTEGPCWVTDNALRVDTLSSEVRLAYLAHFLRQANLNQFASQSGQPLISASRIAEVRVPMPPLTLQDSFITRSSGVLARRKDAERSLSWLDQLFAAIQARAFRGEL